MMVCAEWVTHSERPPLSHYPRRSLLHPREDKHSYASVNDLVLQNIIYCPERLKLNVDWQGAFRDFRPAGQPHWRIGSIGMAQARQIITQLEQESSKRCAAGQ
ncbi:hypothetical protein ACNKHO_25000 [Shigella flexneri]